MSALSKMDAAEKIDTVEMYMRNMFLKHQSSCSPVMKPQKSYAHIFPVDVILIFGICCFTSAVW